MIKSLRAIAALAMAITLGLPVDSYSFRRLAEGDSLDDFTLDRLGGGELSLLQGLGEKATLLIFWAAWSPRSSEALAEMQAYYAKRKDSGVEIVAVNVEHQEWNPESLPAIEKVVTDGLVEYPVLLDRDLAVFNKYGVSAVPSFVLADPDGRVVHLMPGYPSTMRDEFRERSDKLLGLGALEDEKKPVAGYVPKGKSARYFNMAKLLARKGMRKKAIKALEKSLRMDPDFVEAREMLETLSTE